MRPFDHAEQETLIGFIGELLDNNKMGRYEIATLTKLYSFLEELED
jgi:hypothetical protein